MPEFSLALIDREKCLSWGVDMAPCQAACPLSIDIEGYVTAIGEGNLKRALEFIREKCPLPSACGRVCHHPCEFECKRGKVDEPLAIRALKRFVTDSAHGEKERPAPIERTKAQKVAIIGSGPAGLTAAHDLIKQGYGVTVYEALPVAGGMLAFGIPEFDLPQETVQGEIDYLRNLGIEIKLNTPIGDRLTLADLWQQGYQATLIATGAQESAQLPIPGIDLERVIYALPFLRNTKLGKRISLEGKVVIIGGGNVAIDAARTALRLGAGEVDLVCIESRETMPAFPWMIKPAEAEGIRVHPSQAPQALRSQNGKRVSQVDLKKVAHSERDREGRVTWTLEEGPDSSSSLEADWVIIAIGQKIGLFSRGNWEDLKASPKGTLVVDPDHGTTNVAGIFAAGDIVAMPSTVVESMAAGRKAASSIDRYLQGRNVENETPAPTKPKITGSDILPEGIPSVERREMPLLPAQESLQSFTEVELGFTKDQAIEEAWRCLKCKTCNLCLQNTYCVALSSSVHGGKKSPLVKGNICEGCGRCARACPYRNIHLTQI